MSADARLGALLAKFTPTVETQARAAPGRMRARLPAAVERVHDNYNALAIAFGANEKLSVVFSIAVYPRGVSRRVAATRCAAPTRRSIRRCPDG